MHQVNRHHLPLVWGVLVSEDESVAQAGGFIIQIMPDATEETISAIEENLRNVTSVTSLLEEGLTPEDILDKLLGNLNLEILDRMSVGFECDCSRDKVESALVLLNKEDIESIIEDGEPIEVKCHFCNTSYNFDLDDLNRIKNSK